MAGRSARAGHAALSVWLRSDPDPPLRRPTVNTIVCGRVAALRQLERTQVMTTGVPSMLPAQVMMVP